MEDALNNQDLNDHAWENSEKTKCRELKSINSRRSWISMIYVEKSKIYTKKIITAISENVNSPHFLMHESIVQSNREEI